MVYQDSFIQILSNKKDYIPVTSSSPDEPETLGAFLWGVRSDRKECSFDVDATLKFKRPSTASEFRDSNSDKYCFNSTNRYRCVAWGYPNLARINVILLCNFLSPFCLTINFRIFWTSAMAIWKIAHLNCSSMSSFLSVNRFCSLPIAK